MTVLESVGTYLAANGQGTVGTNLFLGRLPTSPDACVAVYEYQGAPPREVFGASALIMARPRIQVVVRGARDDYPTARDKTIAIRDLLAAITDQTLSGIRVLRLSAVGSVNPLGPDSSDRPLLSINFDATVAQ